MARSQICSPAAITAAVLVSCLLPVAVFGARTSPSARFILQGRVFCDTCRAGFETRAATYIEGAKVSVECRGRSGIKTCSYDGYTDSSGTYNILIEGEHEQEICEVKLASSPDASCGTEVPGREKARVFLSHNNGIASDIRYANALGYQKNTPLALCAELMKEYQQYDD